MIKKIQPEISIDEFLRNNLQATLRSELGRKQIESTELPESFSASLNPAMCCVRIRPGRFNISYPIGRMTSKEKHLSLSCSSIWPQEAERRS